MNLKEMTKEIHECAKEKGWWKEKRTIPELLCLIHSEVSEALQEYRNKKSIGNELADIIIRTLDMAEGLGIDIEKEILEKMEYNKTRPYRHGGKIC